MSNKPRLYVALYARGNAANDGEQYHWALISGPKSEKDGSRGYRHHAKLTIDPPSGQMVWQYECRDILIEPSSMLLVRITIAKITDDAALHAALQRVPVVQGDANWNCRIWVRDAVRALGESGRALGTKYLDWSIIEGTAIEYAEKKIAQGRFLEEQLSHARNAPTFDLLTRQESFP